MAELKVRKLEAWVVDVWRQRAQRAGHSLEEELRQLLTQEALKSQVDFASQAAVLRAEIARVHGILSDSSEHVRAEREARG